jgi:diguanylate cyclase (GGDEF)-like protein/PAS domain S-box-containing protein
MLVPEPMLRRWLTDSSRVNFAIAPFCIVVVGIVWATALDRIEFERSQTVADVMKQNANLAIAFEEHTVRTLKGVDQMLLFIKHEREEPGSKLAIRALLTDGIIENDLLTYIGVVDEQGDLTLGSEQFKPTNLADREWFKVHQLQNSGALFIGKPLLGRVTGKWAFQMSRRLDKPDGSFGGVVYASVDPAYFLNFYRQTDLGDDGLVTLVGVDAITRARRVGPKNTFGEDMRESSLFAEHAQNSAGSFVSTGTLDHKRRLISYRSLAQYPLIVAVGTSQTEAMAPFYRREHNYYMGSALFSLFVVACAAGLMVAWSRQNRAIVSVARSEARLRATFDQAAVGIVRSALDLRILEANPKLCEMLGYSQEELLGRNLLDLTGPEDLAKNNDLKNRLLADPSHPFSPEMENRYLRKDGSVVWAVIALALVRGNNGDPDYLVTVIRDITERKRAEERLAYLAWFDALTGLPNRHGLQDHLTQMLVEAQRTGGSIGCMIVKLDHFKDVNSIYGRRAGDQLLVEVAERLRSSARDCDTVGRLGDDEFALVLSNLPKAEDAGLVAQKVIDALAPRFNLGGVETYISANIGIAIYPDYANDPEELLKKAEQAMHDAKEKGRNTFHFYLPRMNERALKRLQLDASLRRAFERKEFLLHYQPKVDLATGVISGLEALLRWQHPERGRVAAAEFVPCLEETGLIAPVGEWVLQTVCEQIKVWQARGITVRPVAVNVSAQQFHQADFDAQVRALIAQSGVDCRLIELEITESMLMHNPAEAAAMLSRLKRIGVKLSIDDFGTGYSSLAYLKRFPLDALKIDRTFVRDLTVDSDDAEIALAIISLAHNLKLKVVAEGVETEAQMNFLRSHDCDEMQGYYFARPLSVEDCTRALIEGRRLHFPKPRIASPSAGRIFRPVPAHIDGPTRATKDIELAAVELEWLRRCSAHTCAAPPPVVAALERAGFATLDDVGRLKVNNMGRDYVISYDSQIKKRLRKRNY